MNGHSSCAIIIVTHNSEKVISRCLECLQLQTLKPRQIIIVDSGSDNLEALEACKNRSFSFQLVNYQENIGFCRANNAGYRRLLPECRFVLFLNPDTFLPPDFLENAERILSQDGMQRVGALSGTILGYDPTANAETGKYDSTGIFKTWYGRWYDRGQGDPYPNSNYSAQEKVPAICGALMLCRKEALDQVLLHGMDVMDASFFMYKEDIDLSLRLRDKGWDLLYEPKLAAFHCRGWKKERQLVPKHLRLLSAKNEMRLYARRLSPFFLYSAIKYAAVKWLNR